MIGVDGSNDFLLVFCKDDRMLVSVDITYRTPFWSQASVSPITTGTSFFMILTAFLYTNLFERGSQELCVIQSDISDDGKYGCDDVC